MESVCEKLGIKAKSNRVDIKAKNSKDEIILVEIQLEHQADFLERILFGVSKTIIEHIGKSQNYTNVKKVYSINILYFNLGQGKDYIYHGTNSFKGLNTGDTLAFNKRERKGYQRKEKANIFPEYYIIRVNQFEKESAETPLEEWMLYLRDGYIHPDTTTPGLQKARECLRILSMPEAERKAYERFLYDKVSEEDTIETAREDGWFEGYDEAILEITQKMKDAGIDEELISEITKK